MPTKDHVLRRMQSSVLETVRDDECPICVTQYGQPYACSRPCQLQQCKHVFGLGCIIAWLNDDKQTCPTCRAELWTEEADLDFGDPDQSSQSAHEFYALVGTWVADLAVALIPPRVKPKLVRQCSCPASIAVPTTSRRQGLHI